MPVSVIIEPIISLFIAIFIGFVAAKSGYLPEKCKDAISKVIVKITLPLLILTSLLSKDLTADTAKNACVAALAAVVVVITLYFAGILTAKLFKLLEPKKTLHAILSATGNVVFLGYPVITAVYGTDGLFYAVIYGMVNDILLWSLGVYLINKSSKNENKKDALNKLLNPNTISFLIGIPLMFLKVKLPPVIHETLSGIGSLTTYLSMIFIGMVLSQIDIKKIYKRVSMISTVIVKMILAPVAAAFLLKNFGINPITCGAIILEIAMPAQTVTSIIANEAGSDTQYAAEYIFLSTIASIVTLPLVYFFIEKIM